MELHFAPEKRAKKISRLINNSAMRCPILLKFGRLMHYGAVKQAS